VRDELVRLVADRLDFSVHAVNAALAGSPTRPVPARPPTATNRAPASSPGAASLASERSFLAMCLAAGELGRDYLGRLRDGHFSSDIGRRARDHLSAHFEDPLSGMSQEDPALEALVTGAAMDALDREGVSEPVLRMDFLQLEMRRVERELRGAGEHGDLPRQSRLAREKQDVRSELDAVMGQAEPVEKSKAERA
jgi:hypothetical protein